MLSSSALNETSKDRVKSFVSVKDNLPYIYLILYTYLLNYDDIRKRSFNYTYYFCNLGLKYPTHFDLLATNYGLKSKNVSATAF